MAWGRLALIQVAGDDTQTLDKLATVFGYEKVESPDDAKLISPNFIKENPHNNSVIKHSDKEENKKIDRPPSQFLRVTKIQNATQKHEDNSDYLSDSAMLLSEVDEESFSYNFASPSPLLMFSQLSPFLLKGLGAEKQGKKVNHNQLAKQLAKGQALQKLPYFSQQRWPHQLTIIIDAALHLEPYWSDFAEIVKPLKTLLGQESVNAIAIEEESLDEEYQYCISWPTNDDDEYIRWKEPPTGSVILLLSDLGVSDPQGIMSLRWSRFIKGIDEAVKILTLSPAKSSPQNSGYCRRLKPNSLNDFQYLPRNPSHKGFSLAEYKKEQLEQILALLSPLPVIDVGLLRQLRLEFQWGSSELESIIWNHSKIRKTSLGICLRSDVAEKYRQHYKKYISKTQNAIQLWEVVYKHHKHSFEGLQRLENLNKNVLENKTDKETQEYFRRVLATVSQKGTKTQQGQALLMQCRTILAAKPESIWDSQHSDIAYDLYATVHADDIRQGNWPDALEQGFDLSRLQNKLDFDKSNEVESWYVIQIDDSGQFLLQKEVNINKWVQPIAIIESLKQFPPTLQFPPVAKFSTQIAKEKNSYSFPEKDSYIRLQSITHTIELDAISKPSWANSIKQSKQGLQAGIQWGANEYITQWNVSENLVKSHWSWQAPFGEDQYGIYADLTHKNITQRFRWIEPNTFLMGSPEDEAGREAWSKETQHQVTLTQGYWLADTAITQEFWQAVMGENPSHFTKQITGLGSTKSHPVEQVSWDDCQQFISKLKQHFPEMDFRLPTEAEWENACRAGSQTAFNFGNEPDLDKVNYSGIFDKAGYDDKALQRTTPVKSYACNDWGLYEMHGNVWEWCKDYWSNDLGTEAIIDPETAKAGSGRVLRGGGWGSFGGDVRSAIRSIDSPDYRSNFIGLRLAIGQSSTSLLKQKSSRAISTSGQTGSSVKQETVSTEVEIASGLPKKQTWFDKLNPLKK